MIEEAHPDLSIKTQCELLDRSRSWYYYRPQKNHAREQAEENDKRKLKDIAEAIPFYTHRRASEEAKEDLIPLSNKRAS